MLLLFHVLSAFASVVAASAAYINPSVAKLRMTYFLSTAMLTSGTYLVMQNTTHLLEACVMGLVFLAVVSFEVVRARSKLSRTHAEIGISAPRQ